MMRGNDPVDVIQAPIGSLGWATSTGWITDPVDVLSAEQSDTVFHVGVDRRVSIRGVASLAALALCDKRILTLRREIDEIRGAQ
jgi:hypothetical protein